MTKTCVTAFPSPAWLRAEAKKARAAEDSEEEEEEDEEESGEESTASGASEGHKTPGEMHYPGIKYGGAPVAYAAEVRFLGLLLDEAFKFDRHVQGVAEKIGRRKRILRSVAGASWGCRRTTLRTLYLSLMQSITDFALPAYAPFVREEALKPVQREEKSAAMCIGGTVARTRLTAIYGEARLDPIGRRAQMKGANMYERLRRMPKDNPARAMAERPEPRRRGAQLPAGWRRQARETVAAAGLAELPRDPIPTHCAESVPGRAVPERLPTFVPFLAERVTRRDSKEKRKAAAEKSLGLLPTPQVRVFTDGSVLRPDKVRDGGGGYYIEDAAGKEHRGRCPAGRVCDSFRAELHALRHALRTLATDEGAIAVPPGAEIQLLTDSQSGLRALEAGPWRQRSTLGQQVWQELCRASDRHGAHATLAYIPGHADIAGNEAADEEAKEAAKAARASPGGDSTPVPFQLARTVLREQGRNKMWAAVERDSHWWEVTQGRPPKWPRGLTRGQERIIAQLRAGKCPIVAGYLHLIKKADSPACAQCGAAVEDVRHLICQCPAYEPARQLLYAEEKRRDLTILARRPVRVMQYLRAIRREGCAAPKERREAQLQSPARHHTHTEAASRCAHDRPASSKGQGRAC